MMIAKEMSITEVVGEIISENVRKKCSGEYLEFLRKVYAAITDDIELGEGLEVAMEFETRPFPTILEVEKALAGKDGCIRPLLEQKGIVEPMPKVEV